MSDRPAFGHSPLYGGYAGGQAEYVRVPYADVEPIKVGDGLTDEQVLFLTDIFPTGYQAAEYGNIQGGETVVIWGCGPVGQFAIKSAYMLGAGRGIAIDRFPGRLEMAHGEGGAEVINYEEGKIDPSFVITHRLTLDDAPHGYDIFLNKEDGCIKVVMKP